MNREAEATDTALKKIADLRARLTSYRRVVVAFSGGVDSTVLLDNACQVLGRDQVIACFAESSLLSPSARENARTVYDVHFSGLCRLETVTVNPLALEPVAANHSSRCYHCKFCIYRTMLDEVMVSGATLVDGTNADDLQTDRPGLRAVRELGVATPLADAGLTKAEIRAYAKKRGLRNHDLPANSCLATRIDSNTLITKEILALVAEAEAFVQSLGVKVCRVRPRAEYILLETGSEEIDYLLDHTIRTKVRTFFSNHGFRDVFISLSGR